MNAAPAAVFDAVHPVPLRSRVNERLKLPSSKEKLCSKCLTYECGLYGLLLTGAGAGPKLLEPGWSLAGARWSLA